MLTRELLPCEKARLGELARLARRAHGASGLSRVRAIAIATRLGKSRHVVERIVDLRRACGQPRLQLAHAGRIDEQSSAGKHEQLTPRRRVPPTTIVGPDRTLELHVAAEETV